MCMYMHHRIFPVPDRPLEPRRRRVRDQWTGSGPGWVPQCTEDTERHYFLKVITSLKGMKCTKK